MQQVSAILQDNGSNEDTSSKTTEVHIRNGTDTKKSDKNDDK